MDEMINALTLGLGPELGKTIRFRYYEQKRRALNSGLAAHWGSYEYGLLCDFIALAVFHESVIVPLHGSLNFMEFSSKLGVSQVRMGEYSIDQDHTQSAEAAVKQFFGILKEYEIDTGLLSLGDMEAYLRYVNSRIHEWRARYE